jgi:dienelactone hydrolase
MSAQTAAPGPGAWPSTVTARLVAGKALRFGSIQMLGENVYWTEARPDEAGRSVLVEWSPEQGFRDVTPAPYSVRSKVHEYGGGEFLAASGGIYFVDQEDQQIYRSGDQVTAITEAPGCRFADMAEDRVRGRLLAVCEDHRADSQYPANYLAGISLDGRVPKLVTLDGNHDFYAFPRLSPNGNKLAFMAWNLPHMPWEAGEIWCGRLADDGSIHAAAQLAGGAGQAAFQPSWGPEGRLYFVVEQDDFAALYVWDGVKTEKVAGLEGDFSRPLWVFGMRSHTILADGSVFATAIEAGRTVAGLAAPGSAGLARLEVGYADLINPHGGETDIAAIALCATAPPAITLFKDVGAHGLSKPQQLRRQVEIELDAGDISAGRQVQCKTGAGEIVHALYYPPANSAYKLGRVLPPAIVTAHGGPSGMAERGFKLKTQFWTSRGFALLDVDYRGSTGYGRAYREALAGQWGVLDVEDVVACARWLTDQDLVDASRLVISGGSAGGYTVLQALVSSDLFAAGAAHYGISDLAQLAAHTHKFEAGYLYALMGADAKDAADVFKARSPLFSADRITSPVIFLQGAEDKVVPPEQSRAMADMLKRSGIPVAYLEFEGEGHGFRNPAHIETALKAEFSFYNAILGLGAEQDLIDLDIVNF